METSTLVSNLLPHGPLVLYCSNECLFCIWKERFYNLKLFCFNNPQLLYLRLNLNLICWLVTRLLDNQQLTYVVGQYVSGKD